MGQDFNNRPIINITNNINVVNNVYVNNGKSQEIVTNNSICNKKRKKKSFFQNWCKVIIKLLSCVNVDIISALSLLIFTLLQ